MVSEVCKRRRCGGEEFTWFPNRTRQAKRIVSARRGRGCPGVEMKRIQDDSDYPSIPRKAFNSETPLR